MEGLLEQYGIGLGREASRSNNGLASVDDILRQLHDVVASKRSATRAEHVSTRFELRMNAVLQITEEADNSLTCALGQLRNPTTRTVTASETVLNQPSDDPKLQRLVAKHLAGSLGAVDDTTWCVRQVSRSAQGWTFIYHCQHSLQTWVRQNSKDSKRPPIGAFSGSGGLDHINLCTIFSIFPLDQLLIRKFVSSSCF
jgi:hypothetical protein